MPRFFAAFFAVSALFTFGSANASVRPLGQAGARELDVLQVDATRAALQALAAPSKGHSKNLLVKLGDMKTEPAQRSLSPALVNASRAAIADIPGVTLMGDGEDAEAMAAKGSTVVVISGKLRELGQAREGDEVVMSAKVEYVLYKLPGRAIAAIVSGGAKARVGASSVKTPSGRQQLEREVVSAAVESAARRAPAALQAAAK